MNRFYNKIKNKKNISFFIMTLILTIFLVSCQGNIKGLEEELELANKKIEEIELKNTKLSNELNVVTDEFNEYKKLMEPYELLHNAKEKALKRIDEFKFIDDEKNEIIKEIKTLNTVDDIESKMEEVEALEINNKKNITEESKNKIDSFSYLSTDEKKDFKENISKSNNKKDIDNITSSARTKNEEEKNKAQSKQEASKQESKNSESNNSSKNKNTGKPVGSVQTAEKNEGQVLVTPTGAKYHSRACGRGRYSPVSLSEAKARGLTPCKKCF